MTAANGLAELASARASRRSARTCSTSRACPGSCIDNCFDFRNRPNVTLQGGARARAAGSEAARRRQPHHSHASAASSSARETIEERRRSSAPPTSSCWSRPRCPSSGASSLPFDVQSKRRVCVDRLGGPRAPVRRDRPDQQEDAGSAARPSASIGVMEKQGGAGFFGGPNFDSPGLRPHHHLRARLRRRRSATSTSRSRRRAPTRLEEFEYEVIGEMRKHPPARARPRRTTSRSTSWTPWSACSTTSWAWSCWSAW